MLLLVCILCAPMPPAKTDGFLVGGQHGLAFLDPDGKELSRESGYTGKLSPDGKWLARLDRKEGDVKSTMIVKPRDGKGKALTVPGVAVAAGEGFDCHWSADSKRVLIVEQKGDGERIVTTHQVFDLKTKKAVPLDLPAEFYGRDWSKDGKRLLGDWRERDDLRVCWLSADGKGEPEFLTPEDEYGYGAKLSPDGTRLLLKAGGKKKGAQSRLVVMDLKTKKRTTLDEPGHTRGYCWSRDGQRVAYTWQKTPTAGDENAEWTTWLITCKADGTESKRITSRTTEGPGDLVIRMWFWVVDWR
ncbi:MAG: hypothetical protein K2W96_16405 [Gemmataceae bacterium]|nr:hypothetical protein [Gemmataceae bacterium]